MSDLEIVRAAKEAGGKSVQVLNLTGQLDAHTFSALQKELEELGDAADPRVVLNCQDLEYVSSAGLGVLKKMSREFRDKAGDIRLASLPPKISNVVNLLGFNQVIQVFGSLDEAVDSFKG
jgi:anti-sigma B factor antagonist